MSTIRPFYLPQASMRQLSARRSSQKLNLRGAGVLSSTLVIMVCIAGCHDNRMSLGEFTQYNERLRSADDQEIVPTSLSLTDFQEYKIQPNDVLMVNMMGVDDPTSYRLVQLQVRVNHNGKIVLPQVGEIHLAGLDFAAAETAIVNAHKEFIPEAFPVYLELVGPDNTTVLVNGAAEQPGLVSLPKNERNILYAMARAGAFGLSSSGIIHYKPISPSREAETFDLTNINDVRRVLTAPALESGDMITVEAADANVVYITGLTNTPGPIPVPRSGSLSLMRAVAAAGGLRELIDVKEATLVRKMQDGEQVRVKLNVKDIHEGKSPDIALVAGDVLQLPHTADTRFQDWVNTNVIRSTSVGVRYDPLQQYNTRRIIDQQNRNSSVADSVLLNLSDLLLPSPQPPVITTP
ncbi:MAG: polysaccharide biosynthesis/export family protein [Phycisphaerae bacterium]